MHTLLCRKHKIDVHMYVYRKIYIFAEKLLFPELLTKENAEGEF